MAILEGCASAPRTALYSFRGPTHRATCGRLLFRFLALAGPAAAQDAPGYTAHPDYSLRQRIVRDGAPDEIKKCSAASSEKTRRRRHFRVLSQMDHTMSHLDNTWRKRTKERPALHIRGRVSWNQQATGPDGPSKHPAFSIRQTAHNPLNKPTSSEKTQAQETPNARPSGPSETTRLELDALRAMLDPHDIPPAEDLEPTKTKDSEVDAQEKS